MNEMNGRDGIPAVLTGDFNCGPESDVITILDQSGFINAYSILSGKSASVGQTFHGFNGGDTGEPIDYIFVTPEVQITSVQVDRSMYNGRYPSDHYPVTARVETNT
jgi:endonuclease/exonuclease/phosphatase family metal-dependent hydrolase